MNSKLINWKEIYNDPALFHIYLTERKRGKTDCKAWTFLKEITTPNSNTKYAWLRRHWHDSLECTKPYFQDLVAKFCESDENIKYSAFEIQEQGLFYQGKKRIYFFDLFSFRKARGKIARGTNFSEIVYEEAIPIDQEVLPREQWKLRDFIQSLKRNEDQPLKVTFLANPYIFSMYFLDQFQNIFDLRKEAEQLANQGRNDGITAYSKDKQWMLYLNLLPGAPDPHSLALEEKLNPSLRNWDDFMFAIKTKQDKYKKYQIIHAIQDFYFVELGERKKHKQYALMHFTKNKKETNNELVNFCFDWEEQAKSKLKNCVLREKKVLVPKWIRMLKEQMLYFTDYRSRDWFLELIK